MLSKGVTWFIVFMSIFITIVVLKVTNTKQAIVVKLVMILFIFLALTLGYVYVQTNPNFDSAESVIGFGKTYFLWVGSFFGNIKTITSDAINLNWEVNKTN